MAEGDAGPEHGDGVDDADDADTGPEADGGNDADAGPDANAADDDTDDEWAPDIPEPVVDEAERLTRLARQAVDDDEAAAYRDRRATLAADHDYRARVRAADDTLVLYPEEWLTDGTVQVDRIEDTDRAVEVSLSGPGDPERWADVEAHNAALVDRVAEAHGPVHAANARAFADFMGNHYAKEVERASPAEVDEFLTEYYPRNAWPTQEQKQVVESSLQHLFDAAGAGYPGTTSR